METFETAENKRGTDNVKLAQLFEVEELEERVEFGKWSANAEGTYATCGGGGCDGTFKGEATYTITF